MGNHLKNKLCFGKAAQRASQDLRLHNRLFWTVWQRSEK